MFANRSGFEWALTSVAAAIAVATTVAIGERVARWLADARVAVGCAPMAEALSRRAVVGEVGRLGGVLQAFWLVAGTIVDLLLVYDSRYRDFPSLLFAPVVVAFVALALARSSVAARRRGEIEERMLGGALVVGAALIVAMELPINASADLWGLLGVALAVATRFNVAPGRPAGDAPAPARRS